MIMQPRDFVKTPSYFGPAPREIRNRQKIWQSMENGEGGQAA